MFNLKNNYMVFVEYVLVKCFILCISKMFNLKNNY